VRSQLLYSVSSPDAHLEMHVHLSIEKNALKDRRKSAFLKRTLETCKNQKNFNSSAYAEDNK